MKPGLCEVIVRPGAKADKILSERPFIVSLKAPAQDNKANMALVKFLSKELKMPVRIKKGLSSKRKLLVLG